VNKDGIVGLIYLLLAPALLFVALASGETSIQAITVSKRPQEIQNQSQQNQSATANPLSLVASNQASNTAPQRPNNAAQGDNGALGVSEPVQDGFFYRLKHDPVSLFTGLLVVTAAVQIFWMQKTVSSAEKTARRQLRAYVLIKKTKVFVERNYDIFTIQAHVHYLNSGQTPAYKLRIAGRLVILPYPLQKGFDLPIPEFPEFASTFAMGKDQHTFLVVDADRPYAKDEMGELMGRTKGKSMYLLGKIEYSDAFGKVQTTPFNEIVIFLSKPVDDEGRQAQALTSPATIGNDAT